MKHIFHESELTFSFSENWKVMRYDEHRYYKIVSGRSISGVDFACITPEDHLILIEVKNFFQYQQDGVINDLGRFAEEMKEKILDTLDLIDIIHRYHGRKWSYRILYGLVRRFPSLHYDWWYWSTMYDLHLSSEKLRFILVLESVADPKVVKRMITDLGRKEDVAMPEFKVLSVDDMQMVGMDVQQSDVDQP